jgi:hypothetical protein
MRSETINDIDAKYMTSIILVQYCFIKESRKKWKQEILTKHRGQVVNTPASFSGGPGLQLGPETGYPDWGFIGFPQSLQANARIVP